MGFLKNLLGFSNEAQVKKVAKIADAVEALSAKYQAMSDEELRKKTEVLRSQAVTAASLDDLLPDSFALVREAAHRTIGEYPFRTQIIGGIVLHQGRIAEMKTGEGKTLACVMPAFLHALKGEGVHVVTVNDYLARYQSEWMGKIYRFLGMEVGVILHDLSNEERRRAYACDVTYGTNNEFGFDYLRDNMVTHLNERVQRPLYYAIVDEVDSILIDEARTPLIISGASDESTPLYAMACDFVRRLKGRFSDKGDEVSRIAMLDESQNREETADYIVDEKQKTVTLTALGVKKAEGYFRVDNLSDMENTDLNHHINIALRAKALMKRDVDYVVRDGEVIIVDEFTGRLMTGRRYSDGLHQAIEAKEGVKVARENRTLATITFQNYFRMYKRLSGMTGTAKTEEEEFRGIYELDVVSIPTNRPMIRKDLDDVVFQTEKAKFDAIVEEIVRVHEQGRPVLVGTVSVEKSERLSKLLGKRGVKHTVLNAKYHEREAEIVAQAGKLGAVTIATNMAGRGTDILLGGNPTFLARRQMLSAGFSPEIIEEAEGHNEDAAPEVLSAREVFHNFYRDFKRVTDAEHEKVVALGGLHIIGTERHESRRVDNQLRGRAGRQGDPGSSRFYIAIEDDLMRLFGGEKLLNIVQKLGLPEDTPIEYGLLTKQIENAQKRVEDRNYDMRKNVLQYDDVMNVQRELIYEERTRVLRGEDIHEHIMEMLAHVLEQTVPQYCQGIAENWDFAGLNERLTQLVALPENSFHFEEKELLNLEQKTLIKDLTSQAQLRYEARRQEATEQGLDYSQVERLVLLHVVDRMWMDHIDNMDRLREGIGLRALAQRDPVQEYKLEGHDMFDGMIAAIEEETVRNMMHVTLRKQPTAPASNLPKPSKVLPQSRVPVKKKVGRNDPCPCGSGKKYKDCHGKTA